MSRRKRMLQQLDDEIREHIETETQDNIARGMSPEEARYAAMRKFGNVTRVKEETREVWSSVWLGQLLQDVRFGLRMLRKSPGFTAVAALTLALGIGANTYIFSVVDALLFRSLEFPDPGRIVALWERLPNAGVDRPEHLHGFLVTPDFFGVIEAQPMLGRTFLSEEGVPGKNHVAVLGYDLWREHFASDSA